MSYLARGHRALQPLAELPVAQLVVLVVAAAVQVVHLARRGGVSAPHGRHGSAKGRVMSGRPPLVKG
jgi:hypothetical protein